MVWVHLLRGFYAPAAGCISCGVHFLRGVVSAGRTCCGGLVHDVDVDPRRTGVRSDREVPRGDECLDVRLDGPLAKSRPLAQPRDRRIATPLVVRMVRQGKHDQPLSRAKRLAVEYGCHDLDAHPSAASLILVQQTPQKYLKRCTPSPRFAAAM